MELWQLLIILGTLLSSMIAFVWLAVRLGSITDGGNTSRGRTISPAAEAVNSAVEQAFTDDFREDLRQRARQQFEKLIHENAMFLQQDVRMSAAQLEDFMKKEVISTLQQELARHRESVSQSQRLLTDSVAKTQAELQRQLQAEKERRIRRLDDQVADIAKKYIIAAVGSAIDTDKQLALVIDSLNTHKAQLIEDIRSDD